MPSKSLWKIVEFIKRDCEEWGEPLQIDEVSLYRHVGEMLDLEREPPELAPAEIVKEHVKLVFNIEVTASGPNIETRTGHIASQANIRAAAKWAWVLFHDFFGEYPPTGDEDGYQDLIHRVLQMRRPHIVERLPPLS